MGFARGVWAFLVALMILGYILNGTWSPAARDAFAGQFAHEFCAKSAQSKACQSDGHPADLFSELLQKYA